MLGRSFHDDFADGTAASIKDVVKREGQEMGGFFDATIDNPIAAGVHVLGEQLRDQVGSVACHFGELCRVKPEELLNY